MAKTFFVPGMPLTADHLNALNNIVCDGQDLDGHRPQITDAELDDYGIKSEVQAFTQSLLATPGSGTSIDIVGGSFSDADGLAVTYPGGTVVLPSDGLFYIYVDQSNEVVWSTILPAICLPIAKVQTSGGAIVGGVQDLRPRYAIRPRAKTSLVLGGSGNQKAFRVTATGTPGWNSDNTEFTVVGTPSTPYEMNGEYEFTKFTVEIGAKVITNGLYVKANNRADISGTIEVLPTINGGAGFVGSLLIPGDIMSAPGSGLGGSGGHSSAPIAYDYQVSSTGSGGGSAFTKGRLTSTATFSDVSDSTLVSTGGGGKGGSFFKLEVAGPIVVSGTITAKGGNGQNTQYNGGIGANQYLLGSGSGGGSGGLIYLRSVTSISLTPSSSFDVSGGNGGAGYITPAFTSSFTAMGGGGGSGGYLVLQAPTVANSSPTITLSGGNPGSSVGTGSNTLSGCPGASYAGNGGASGTSGQIGKIITKLF